MLINKILAPIGILLLISGCASISMSEQVDPNNKDASVKEKESGDVWMFFAH